MADDAKEAWNDVGRRFESWGQRLADRYEAAKPPGGETPQEAQRKLEEAAREITERLDRAFTALDGTFRDEQAKQDLKDAVTALGNAVGATVTEAGEAIRRRVGQNDPGRDGNQEPPNSG
jgi:hypothetical protein